MAAESVSNLFTDRRQPKGTETTEMAGTLELLRKVLHSIRLGIVVIDSHDKIVFFNREAGMMLNEEPEKRIGESILLCHPKTSQENVRQFIDDFRKDPQHRFQRKILNYQGRYLEEDFCSLFDDQGRYLGLVELLYDAEEKVRLLKQLGKFEEPHLSGVGPKAPQRSGGKP